MTIVLATKNPGKLAEIRTMLQGLPVDVVSISEVLPTYVSPIEDGDTFEANAFKKARAVAAATQLVTLADDSGLVVDALGGRPGVRSARYAGEGASDAENNAALLSAMSEVDDPQRTARFRCVIAMVDPYLDLDRPVYAEGRCEGTIARSARGESGFGYDPLFVVTGLGRTFAELSHAEKNALSHRGKAVAALVPHVESLIRARVQEAKSVLVGQGSS
ncbi:MAG: RdgB/HAM1 family non-canonical purine NTP pyrophosphatase [Polyangiaceae bacterium]|nr:RdgB/HAM1 family non-canonical purine NTP pyrophosphatase [Polyangiaceae bacterium]